MPPGNKYIPIYGVTQRAEIRHSPCRFFKSSSLVVAIRRFHSTILLRSHASIWYIHPPSNCLLIDATTRIFARYYIVRYWQCGIHS